MSGRTIVAVALTPALVFTLAGCGGDDGGGPHPVRSVVLSPDSMLVEICHTATLTATVSGGETKALDWYVNHLLGGDSEHGTITQTNPAVYTAPGTIPSVETLMIIAVSREDVTKADTCRFDVVFTTIHVNGTTGDDDTGTGTIVLPLASITKGMEMAGAGMVVSVAPGTYHEHEIQMKSDITLQSETGLADCVTIDAQGEDRVFKCQDVDTAAVIRGFTITGGAASGGSTEDMGGGMFCWGGSPRVINCNFIGNSAEDHGGAVYCHGQSVPRFVNCLFAGNQARSMGSAASLWDFSDAEFVNCTFFGNHGLVSDGAVYCRLSAAPKLTNTIIAFTSQGAAVDSLWVYGRIPTVTCCDFYGNEGGDWTRPVAGMEGINGNFSADPLFCDTLSGDFSLEACSPCLSGNHPDGADCGLIGALEEGCTCGP